MAKVGDAATVGEKELRTEYPVEEGLIAGTTKQTLPSNLEPTDGNTTNLDC